MDFGISEVGSWFEEHLDSGFHRNNVEYDASPLGFLGFVQKDNHLRS